MAKEWHPKLRAIRAERVLMDSSDEADIGSKREVQERDWEQPRREKQEAKRQEKMKTGTHRLGNNLKTLG